MVYTGVKFYTKQRRKKLKTIRFEQYIAYKIYCFNIVMNPLINGKTEIVL